MIRNFMNCFSVARRITKVITISHGDKNSTGESKLIDDYRLDPFIVCIFGSVKFSYIPKYGKYFNSVEVSWLRNMNMFLLKSFRLCAKGCAACRALWPRQREAAAGACGKSSEKGVKNPLPRVCNTWSENT